MTNKYLGEEVVDLATTPYAKYKRKDWALYFIGAYGGIDGAHHKTWVLDQVARILHGAPITIKLAKWEQSEAYRVSVGTCASYEKWVKEMKDPDNTGEDQYGYDEGTPP